MQISSRDFKSDEFLFSGFDWKSRPCNVKGKAKLSVSDDSGDNINRSICGQLFIKLISYYCQGEKLLPVIAEFSAHLSTVVVEN